MTELIKEVPELKILYEDDFIVAIHKPNGLLVHRTYLARKENFFAMLILRDQIGQYVYPIHRLDRATSGVLLFAKSSDIARLLNQQFSERLVIKNYIALVRGHLLETGTLNYPLKEEPDKIADKYTRINKEPQIAISSYKPMKHTEIPYCSDRYPTSRYSLVSLQPHTGRKHQLRRHMAHLRHPIIGDTTHGDGKQNKFFRTFLGINRLWLIAISLQLTHPITGKAILIETQLEEEWRTMITYIFNSTVYDINNKSYDL